MQYFEDLEVGRSWEPGTVEVTEEEILEFARRYDPQPFHVDSEAARRNFDGLIASGWHTAAMCMRPLAESVLHEVAIVAAMGVDDLRWHEPVGPGDRLTVGVSVAEKDRWNDERGLVTFALEATNEDGDLVHSRKDLVVVERRQADE
nr:MaoC/PaaZ C-terminal domain-containing protein [Natrononativus amylolyticus]